nr:caspase family protein [uncultured Roseateles sp.]
MRGGLLCGLLALAAGVVVPAAAADRALLVGVSAYPNLHGRNLEGPANDVRLMQQTVAGMGLPEGQVAVLSEHAGGLPTRANILRGLARLASDSRPGDWVLVYFSGHGAQVPQRTAGPAERIEPDGLDEVFLPRDTQAWDPARQEVRGALRDKDLGAALRRIQARGANVWAVFDTCHAADMLRGPGTAAGWRFLTPQALQIPLSLWTERWRNSLRRQTLGLRGPATQAAAATGRVTPGRYVGFFSSQEGEGTLEELLSDPQDPAQQRRYGLFTYQFALAAQAWTGSLVELAQRIELAYRERPFPTPQFVGDLEGVAPFRRGLAPAPG